jgi:Putative esterase
MAGWRFLALLLAFTTCDASIAAQASSYPEFEVSFPSVTHREPITGRLLLMLSRTNQPEVRYQVGWVNSPPTFGIDVSHLSAGQAAVIDGKVQGFPLRSLRDIPPGEYYVQALLNVYTEFHRADGLVIWAHMDQWEGQQFNISPGNLFSKPQRIRLDGSRHGRIKVSLTEVIPPIQVPPDTEWVKHIKIQSDLLTRFWGRPMYLGAVVLLPRGYQEHPDTRYPVIYQQQHFSLTAPFDFRTDEPPETDEDRRVREGRGIETGHEFQLSWNSDDFPRVIAVTFLHPTPYFDDSYAVDSANNGPYGTAIMTELLPYIEKQFRIITQPYARLLVGGSTGGWEALALQLQHPEVFGGTWTLYPDPIDFRRFQLVDIYRDNNFFVLEPRDLPQWERQEWVSSERAFMRADDGQPVTTLRQESQLESVLGSKGRSGGQLAIWQAAFGPVGADGYPKPLFDDVTGEIDRSVALYMRDHGYDLRYYAETNWQRIGTQLSGKLKFYCGDMDNFYLNLGVRLFGQFLEKADDAYTRTALEYGPMKGHGWQPITNAALVRLMAERVANHSPMGESLAWRSRGP